MFTIRNDCKTVERPTSKRFMCCCCPCDRRPNPASPDNKCRPWKMRKKNGRTTSFAHKLLGATPELRTTYHPLPINTHNKIEREYRQRQYGMVGTYAVCSLVAWMTAHEKCVLCINLSNLSVFFNIDANICGYKVDSRKYMVHSAVANNRQDMYSHFAHRSPNEVELALTPKI